MKHKKIAALILSCAFAFEPGIDTWLHVWSRTVSISNAVCVIDQLVNS